MKQFVVMLAAATVFALGGVSPVLATSDTGSENSNFTVTASLASRGTPSIDKLNVSIPLVLLPDQTLRLAFDVNDPAAPPSSATVTLTIS